MAQNVFYFHPTLHALGTFPVIQQGAGAVCAVAGTALAIYNLVKLIFDGIKKLAGSTNVNLCYTIENDKRGIRDSLSLLIFGLVTSTPVVGTITNAILWYKVTHQDQEKRQVRYVRTRV